VRVFLVDGTYELFRHYFGAPSHRTAEGAEVAATRGVLGSMLQLLDLAQQAAIDPQGGEVLEQHGVVSPRRERGGERGAAPNRDLPLARRVRDLLDRAVVGQDRGGGLGPPARQPRVPVGGVAD